MKSRATIHWPETRNDVLLTEPAWARAPKRDRWLSWWYRWQLNRRVQECGARLRLIGHPVVINEGKLRIGDDVQLVSDYQPVRLAVGQEGELIIGSGTIVNSSIIAVQQHVVIGNNCRLAPFVHFMDSDFHDVSDRLADGKSSPIIIGNGAILGAHTLILRGVTVGEGAELLPGSVVTKDIPAGALAGGVPARIVDRMV